MWEWWAARARCSHNVAALGTRCECGYTCVVLRCIVLYWNWRVRNRTLFCFVGRLQIAIVACSRKSVVAIAMDTKIIHNNRWFALIITKSLMYTSYRLIWHLFRIRFVLSNLAFPIRIADYCQDSWSNTDSPMRTAINPVIMQHPHQHHPSTIPMPTIYLGEGNHRKAPKPSIVELVLYNMSAMLASVGSGYDVRASNVSPIHPKLQMQMFSNSSDNGSSTDCANVMAQTSYLDGSEFYGNERTGYAHNTYHGPTKHVR